MRNFCKPLSEEQKKEITKIWNEFPRVEFWFNCQGDCLIYENGILVGKEKSKVNITKNRIK